MDLSSRLLGASSLLAVLAFPVVAAAQDPLPPPVAPAAAQAQPAPVQIEVRAEASVVEGPYSCSVGEYGGVDAADARTTARIVCSELSKKHARPGAYELRFGRLGPRLLLSVSESKSGEERQSMIQGTDEIPVAVPRLVDALVAHTPFEATQDVDNVVASEGRSLKAKRMSTNLYAGLVGMSAFGVDPGSSGGFDVGLLFRASKLSFGGHARAGGIGSGGNKLGFAGIDAGLRYHLSEADTSAFFGSGIGFSYFKVNRGANGRGGDLSGSGPGAYLEGGVEFFRTSRTGAALSLRADAPFYAVNSVYTEYSDYSYSSRPREITTTERYIVPISLNLAIAFR